MAQFAKALLLCLQTTSGCLLAEGYVIHEGTSCAAYLVQRYGMDPDHILKEWSSYDTIANGEMQSSRSKRFNCCCSFRNIYFFAGLILQRIPVDFLKLKNSFHSWIEIGVLASKSNLVHMDSLNATRPAATKRIFSCSTADKLWSSGDSCNLLTKP